jgi:hypothetical protein
MIRAAIGGVIGAALFMLIVTLYEAVTYNLNRTPEINEKDRLCAEATTNMLLNMNSDRETAQYWAQRWVEEGCDETR